ncbi:hypothetical protein BU17DRAFT_51577 [Hysterangium stoloniferum]|nr:hypothetical protein BU17DRAFT_51577 [Hysterangium stoloniferum]
MPLFALHHLLCRTDSIIWDVRFHPSTSRHPGSNEHMASPTKVRISATEPKTRGMKIIFDHFKWEIEVFPSGRECVLVEDVLLEIYDFLQAPLSRAEWYKLGKIMERTRIHACRCDRLIDGPATYELDSSIKLIDILGIYTVFGGLTPLRPMEWLLTFQERPDHG